METFEYDDADIAAVAGDLEKDLAKLLLEHVAPAQEERHEAHEAGAGGDDAARWRLVAEAAGGREAEYTGQRRISVDIQAVQARTRNKH